MPLNLFSDIRCLAITFALALVCGWVFLKIGVPAPFLMGSLFGVWFSGGALPKLRPHLGVARWFHVPVVLGLGVLIGANFKPEVISTASQWWVTVAMMVLTTVVVTAITYRFLRHHRGYDPLLAFFCSVPGGQAEVLAVARQKVSKDYVVALFHLVRVTVVFLSTPLLLAFIEGQEAVIESNDRLITMPGLLDLPPLDLLFFVILALVGFGLGRLLRLPMPHLLGPMGLSIIAHLTGFLDLPRISEFIILAQLVIGGGIGARLASVSVHEVLEILKDAIIVSIMILACYLVAAVTLVFALGSSFLSLWLAFVPGGLYEVTLLALIFGFDVAFVVFHHTIRIVMIFLALPVFVTRLGARRVPSL
jgi:membrane AbrB-like protein